MATPYLYCYGVGGLVFAVGMVLAWKQGYINRTPRGLRNLAACVFVLLFFAGVQGYLQFAPMQEAPPVAYQGGAEEFVSEEGKVRGQPIDYVIMVGYFLAILGVGTWFARRQRTVKDFFFGGQRFSWWLIAMSLVATTVGSYSFVKYSNKGFGYGLSSSQTYLNDWIWFPLLAFGWLPILYFSRVTSVPEYLGRRFNSGVRFWATILVLVYLIGYVGVNLFTMGKVLNALVGWPVPMAAIVVALISCIYVTAGGQTSVIMTDLLQGVMLLVVGALILILGIQYLGGFNEFWTHLPRESRLAFPNFNQDAGFPTVGIFWQDAIANTGMFYLINQGIIMRFLATRSLAESRKAAFAMVVLLMTVAACVVGGGGWVARALVNAGHLPADVEADRAFYVATEFLSQPGMFGLILASLTAALMSTVDTLITAVAAIIVNDIYRPYINPKATEKQQLSVARMTSISVSIIGVGLVPLFMMFDSIYEAHGAFTAAVTPPLVVTLVLSVFWPRFTATAALATLIGGLAAIGISLFFPQVIIPFAHGVPMSEAGDGFLAGMKQFKFMRACYGICISSVIGVVVTLITRPEPKEKQKGLVWGTLQEALASFKGSPGDESVSRKSLARPQRAISDISTGAIDPMDRAAARVTQMLADDLNAREGDLLYVSDKRAWLGGLRSTHAVIVEIFGDESNGKSIELSPDVYDSVVTPKRTEQPLKVERLY